MLFSRPEAADVGQVYPALAGCEDLFGGDVGATVELLVAQGYLLGPVRVFLQAGLEEFLAELYGAVIHDVFERRGANAWGHAPSYGPDVLAHEADGLVGIEYGLEERDYERAYVADHFRNGALLLAAGYYPSEGGRAWRYFVEPCAEKDVARCRQALAFPPPFDGFGA